MTEEALVRRYMTGSCHALAYILSEVLAKPVGVLQACRSGERPIKDPLHVYVVLDETTVLDVKGSRSRASMEADFNNLVALLKTHEGDELSFVHSELGWASGLYEDMNFDSSVIRQASIDLGNGLWDELQFPDKPTIESSEIRRMFSKVTFEDGHSFGL